jgi:MFS superfamily sulfate permease-like transporter
LVVLLVAIPLSRAFDLSHQHHVNWGSMAFDVGPQFLVRVPQRLLDAVTFPDFSPLPTVAFWKHVMLFTFVAGLESLLSAKAIDTLDPWGRSSNFNQDLIAQGAGNMVAGLLGGLPMISEIVRSSANVAAGGRTRMANFFHGLFLFLFVALVPWLVHLIPLSALAAMLVVTGFRLASPSHFRHAAEIGKEQLSIFATTVVVTLAVDLLAGIAAGVVLKWVFHLVRGVAPKHLFIAEATHTNNAESTVISLRSPAVFSTYLSLRKLLDLVPASSKLIVDVSGSRVVDHTVLERLDQQRVERARAGGALEIHGLETLRPVSAHPRAAHVRRRASS